MEKFYVAGPFLDGPFIKLILSKDSDTAIHGYFTEEIKLDQALAANWQRHLNHWLDRLGDQYQWPTDILRTRIPETIELENLPVMPPKDLSQPCMVAMEFTKVIELRERLQ